MGSTRRAAAGVIGVLLVAACGSAGPGDDASAEGQLPATASATGAVTAPASDPGSARSPGPSQAGNPAAPASITVNLPAVDVVDVASGATHSLASLVAADRPTLLWMWAPY